MLTAVTAVLLVGGLSLATVPPGTTPGPGPASPVRHLAGARPASFSTGGEPANPYYGWVTATVQQSAESYDYDLFPADFTSGTLGDPVNIGSLADDTAGLPVSNPVVTPNGADVYLDVGGDTTYAMQPLWVYEVATGTLTQLSLPNTPEFEQPSVWFAPSGTTAYVWVPGSGTIYVIDVSSPASVASSVTLTSPSGWSITDLTLASDGTLYGSDSDGAGNQWLVTYSLADGSMTELFEINDSSAICYTGLSVDPGSNLAYVTFGTYQNDFHVCSDAETAAWYLSGADEGDQDWSNCCSGYWYELMGSPAIATATGELANIVPEVCFYGDDCGGGDVTFG